MAGNAEEVLHAIFTVDSGEEAAEEEAAHVAFDAEPQR
jgi:hypothetical protein